MLIQNVRGKQILENEYSRLIIRRLVDSGGGTGKVGTQVHITCAEDKDVWQTRMTDTLEKTRHRVWWEENYEGYL